MDIRMLKNSFKPTFNSSESWICVHIKPFVGQFHNSFFMLQTLLVSMPKSTLPKSALQIDSKKYFLYLWWKQLISADQLSPIVFYFLLLLRFKHLSKLVAEFALSTFPSPVAGSMDSTMLSSH